MKTASIGIRKWAGEMAIRWLGSVGGGDAKVTAWIRQDGDVALETNGDPVFGEEAKQWCRENF